MKRRPLRIFGSFVLGATVFFAAPSAAQQGPYYPLPSWNQLCPRTRDLFRSCPCKAPVHRPSWTAKPGWCGRRRHLRSGSSTGRSARVVPKRKHRGPLGMAATTIEELSLLDRLSPSPDSGLPSGHPFDLSGASPFFWSAVSTIST